MIEPLVSVIIPNYNAEEYISACIESVERQTYENIEIIIIDDGSTDSSVQIVSELLDNYNNLILHTQENQNASIARNEGMKLAKGTYFLFLDSDDILYEDAIANLVASAEKNKADLVIGNYKTIDRNTNVIRKCNVVKKDETLDEPMKYVGTVPNPSNKLYVRDIIESNRLIWGNVRIGQDLNFYLKYLSCCKKINTVSSYIYGWRILQGSISNSFNFKIFDITESFKDVKRFYSIHGKEELYQKYISAVEYRHYYLQMEKQKNFKDKKAKKIVVDYFHLMLSQIDLRNSINSCDYIGDFKKCKYKLMLKQFYVSRLYKWIDNKFARKSK